MSKYDSLKAWLTDHDGTSFSMAFAALEAVLGFELPSAALERRQWWSNGIHGAPQAAAWGDAGWKVVAVDLAAQNVRFERSATQQAARAA